MGKNLGRMFWAVILVSLLALPMIVGAAPVKDQSDTKVGIESHTWGNYHWARTSNPFTLKFNDNVTSIWDTHLATASTDWSQSKIMDTAVVPDGTKSKRCKPALGSVKVCNDKYGNNGWLGIAQIWVNGDHITQGVVKMNDTYFNTATYNKPEWRQLVMCQEIGHTFGLDHQDETFDNTNLGTCMDYTNDPTSNQHPNQHDYDQLNMIYSHLDSTTTIASLPEASSRDFSAPSDWGKRIRASKDGHSEVYLRDFGKGNKMITFVFWAK